MDEGAGVLHCGNPPTRGGGTASVPARARGQGHWKSYSWLPSATTGVTDTFTRRRLPGSAGRRERYLTPRTT